MSAMRGASVLLADDDVTFCRVLSAALADRGFDVHTAHDAASALARADTATPDYGVIDLKMPGANGLDLIVRLRHAAPSMQMVVLTGYASIATAVEAIKLGAVHYLAKPADADQVVAAFARTQGDAATVVEERRLSPGRLAWEHIQAVLRECDGNVSATARRLGMHRRTLQRKLAKRPAR